MAIVLSVLLRFTDSDYPLGIFRIFLRAKHRQQTTSMQRKTMYFTYEDNLHIFLISHFIRNGCLIPLETNISYPIHPLRVAIKTPTHRSIHVQHFYLHDLVLENLFSACILLNYLLNSG